MSVGPGRLGAANRSSNTQSTAETPTATRKRATASQ